MKYCFLHLFLFTSFSYSQNSKETGAIKKENIDPLKNIFLIKKAFLFFLFFSQTIFGQNQTKIDSLHKVILNTNETEIKLEAYKEILFLESSSNLDNIIFNVEKIKDLNKVESCPTCLGVALYWEGLYHYLKGDLKKGIPIFEAATEIAFEAGDYYTSNRSLTLLSGIYFGLNDYPNAEKYANQLISNGETQKGVTDALMDGYFMKGLINDDQSYYSLAIGNYNKADSLNTLKKGSNFYSYQAKLYNNMSIVFIQIKDFEKAASYLEKTEANFLRDKDKEGLYQVKQNFGYLEVERENYQKAIEILSETNRYYKALEMKHKVGQANYLLGRAYYGLDQYESAIQYLDQSLMAFINIGDTLNAGLSHKYLGDSYLKIDDFKNSENNFEQALTIFNSYNAHRNQLNTLKSYSSIFEKKKNYKQALSLFKQLDSINSIFQIKQNEKRVFELDTKYQTQKKEQEIELLTTQNKLVEQQKKNQRNILVSTIIVLALGGFFFFFQYRNRKKINNKLRELDKVKSTFFANISHEFRTPLTLISGPIQQLIKKDNLQEEDKENLQNMQANSQRLISLVDQLLDLSKIETGSLALHISKNNLITFVGTLADSFHFILKEKDVNFITHINPSISETWFDKTMIEKIVLNLLSNAQKYTPNNGTIVCSANVNNNRFYFEVKNSGEGINENDINKIFDRFYQANTNQQGVGIGLALIKELVTLHKGTISVKSTPQEWTTFSIELPIDKNSFKNNIIEDISELDLQDNDEVVENLIQTETTLTEIDPIDSDLPILLLVEDNTEVRNYLYAIFKDQYLILQANNGEEGITKALEKIPDLIISDIMMPIKNGIELCNKLKADERTSHIPIILLTAKVGEENELEGIKTGADDYITKPFNQDLLVLKVEKYIEVRKNLQERYSQELILKPTDITLNSADELFLGKVQEVIDNKIIESSFSIDDFCKSVGMSRMQLHRKLKALTGQTTSEFIRSQRLKIAAELLKSSDVNISQIGYSVGFNNPAYFSKCFKELYHCSPTEYAKNKN